MKHLLPLCLLALLASCAKKNESKNSVYFSGQIVHPTSDYVVLYKGDKAIDSARLNKDNRFTIEVDDLEPGLHHFEHAPEHQYVYLEPGDSVLIRLNTMAFDESLAFFGSNEQINNFLIEMFLSHEDEEQLISSFYRLSPTEFEFKTDSLRQMKIEEFNTLLADVKMSPEAQSMGRAVIDFSNYVYREKYPFVHRKKANEEIIHKLSSDFYAYRENLDVNSEQLSYLEPYYKFLKFHFGNLTYTACAEECGMTKHSRKDFLHLNSHKLNLIDSLVEQETLKNNLIRNVVLDYLIKVHRTDELTDAFLKQYNTMTTHEGHKEEIRAKYQGIKDLQFGAALPSVKVYSMSEELTSFPEIAKGRHTLFYFWSGHQLGHFKNVSRQVEQLQKERPDWIFVGINLETDDIAWKALVRKMQVDSANQYRIQNRAQIKHLVHDLNQCIIARDTVILNGFAHMRKTALSKETERLASQ